MTRPSRSIPKNCPITAGAECAMVRTSFIKYCLEKQYLEKEKRETMAQGKSPMKDSFFYRICMNCSIGKEVKKGKFRRPPQGLSFIHPYELIKRSKETF